MMTIVIVGNGKLADSILEHLGSSEDRQITSWKNFDKKLNEKIVFIHAGSGRELSEVINYCNNTNSILIELSTGNEINSNNITIINCPNTSLLILKFMKLLNDSGTLFHNEKIEIIESHQSSKKTIPGTAFEIAKNLNLTTDKIISIREPKIQEEILGIPKSQLDLHAYHKITIKDFDSEISIETKVLGHMPYIAGIDKILNFIKKIPLKHRIYQINELIELGLR